MVLFTSVRPLERAENLKAVYDAYDGPKEFVQRKDGESIHGIHSGRFRLVVTDGLIEESPGKYIWIGHGMGAGKKVGLQHPTWTFRGSGLMTYAIASSEYMVPIVAGYCGIPESRVIPLGMPRTDAYFHSKPDKKPYKRHLYVPTFRAGNWMPDFNAIHRLLPEGNRMTVKLHMVTGDRFNSMWQGIEAAPSMVPSTPYLVNTDTVITDFSSIMFDAMVLRKLVILFAKDREDYLKKRGMFYLYPSDYSANYCETEKDLVEMMQTVEWDERAEKKREFFCGACDGHSTERTVDLIKEVLCES